MICIYSDHMEDRLPASRELYKDFLKLSNHVVFPCEAIKKKCLNWIPEIRHHSVIVDPWQVNICTFNTRETNDIKAIWLGHESKFTFMAPLLNDLKNSAIMRRKKINLTILTSQWRLDEYSDCINEAHDGSNLNIRKVKWIHKQ